MNARIKGAYEDYLRSNMTSIYHAYAKPSVRKVDAWNGKCHNIKSELGGRDLKVIRGNCDFFSAGFVYTNPVDGNDYFCWIKPSSTEFARIN